MNVYQLNIYQTLIFNVCKLNIYQSFIFPCPRNQDTLSNVSKNRFSILIEHGSIEATIEKKPVKLHKKKLQRGPCLWKTISRTKEKITESKLWLKKSKLEFYFTNWSKLLLMWGHYETFTHLICSFKWLSDKIPDHKATTVFYGIPANTFLYWFFEWKSCKYIYDTY